MKVIARRVGEGGDREGALVVYFTSTDLHHRGDKQYFTLMRHTTPKSEVSLVQKTHQSKLVG